jgi:para-aminobenzoate synthetase component 1
MNDSIILLEDGKNKLIAIGEESVVKNKLKECSTFIEENKGEYIFGFLSYDAKNQIELLSSENPSRIEFPELYFCVPKFVVRVEDGQSEYLKGSKNEYVENLVEQFVQNESRATESSIELTPTISKAEYLQKVKRLQEHIQYGDIYEVTFCQEYFAQNADIDPFGVYANLVELTKAPFSCFVHQDGSYLLSGSPERFMEKRGSKLTSQPIKGTSKRGLNKEEDELSKQRLIYSTKEKAENVMIVDLVRNDLSRIAKRNSVRVDELFGVYSFRTVHQLISTISAELKEEVNFEMILQAMFPMGSMTGAPKISAMKLIEKYETFKRGLFSGSVGYISPDGDFDFNVVIRSILYDERKKEISCPVGGAITIQSIPEEEYEECLLKVEALKKALIT